VFSTYILTPPLDSGQRDASSTGARLAVEPAVTIFLDGATMRIGIISDTHDRVERTGRAVRLLIAEGAEVLVHCGDLTGPDVVYECAALPSYYVFGNNDFDEDGLRRAMALVGGTCLSAPAS